MNELQGKRILVTGAAKGIGRGIAEVLAREGADLFLHFRSSPDEAESLRQELAPYGTQLHFCQADLGRIDGLEALFQAVTTTWGTLDGAVNNAGWDPGSMPLSDVTYDMYDKLTSMNIRGTLFCTLREMELMRLNGHGGSIVNLGSVQMDTTVLGRTLYATSKGAIHSMSGQLALEGGRDHIRVNVIAPGYIAVPRMTDKPDYDEPAIAAGIPAGRVGVPRDIGELASFLLSDRADYITGQTFIDDGGVSRKLARTATI